MDNAESLMIEHLKRFQTSGTLHRWSNSNKSRSMSSGSGVSTLKYVLNCMLELQSAESKKAHIYGPLTFS